MILGDVLMHLVSMILKAPLGLIMPNDKTECKRCEHAAHGSASCARVLQVLALEFDSENRGIVASYSGSPAARLLRVKDAQQSSVLRGFINKFQRRQP